MMDSILWVGLRAAKFEYATSEPNVEAMNLINTITASNSSGLSDTTSFLLSYKTYLVTFENLLPGQNNVGLQCVVHSGGTFSSSSYNGNNFAPSGAAITTLNSSTFIPLNATGGSAGQANTGPGLCGYLMFCNPAASSNHNIGGLIWYNTANSPSQGSPFTVGTLWSGAAAIDGFQINVSSSNIASGTVRVYGIKT